MNGGRFNEEMVVRRSLLILALALIASGSGAAAQEASDDTSQAPWTGIVGQVVLAERCPVPLGDADEGTCPSVAVTSVVTVRSADAADEVASVATDANGAFSVALDPGSYVVEAAAANVVSSRSAAVVVTVASDQPTPLLVRLPRR